mgnify:CR=1 FL=1
MKFTKENVIKLYGEHMDFDDDEMLKYDDFVLEIMNMDDGEEVTE